MKKTAHSVLIGLGFVASFGVHERVDAAVCIGNCGTTEGVFSGSIVAAPTNFGSYDWVSTNLGLLGAAQISGFSQSATNGSELISDPFFASAGQKVSFYFNYVTSDGSGFADYAFAQLVKPSSSSVVSLFTARTQPTGTIAPGENLPGVEAMLTPATVGIIPGAPSWDPLGGSSGSCYSAGCGYTGWIFSEYEITDPGTYELRFGVANWNDTAYDSGLAFSGLVLDGNTIGDGSSFHDPLLPGEIDTVTGAFEFEFVATPETPVVIDPEVATGYDFWASEKILTAEWEDLGDPDGYEILFEDEAGTSFNEMFLPSIGTLFDFGGYVSGGVSSFSVKGIDTSLMLDPTDTTAFMTGLTFNVATPTTIQVTQTPSTTFVGDVPAVPEPSTWLMLTIGLGFVGGTMRSARRKKPTALVAA